MAEVANQLEVSEVSRCSARTIDPTLILCVRRVRQEARYWLRGLWLFLPWKS